MYDFNNYNGLSRYKQKLVILGEGGNDLSFASLSRTTFFSLESMVNSSIMLSSIIFNDWKIGRLVGKGSPKITDFCICSYFVWVVDNLGISLFS